MRAILEVDKKNSKYNLIGLDYNQLFIITNLLHKLNTDSLTKDDDEYYSNDNLIIKLDSEERESLKDFFERLY